MQEQRTVAIHITGAIIAPVKTDGSSWDEPGGHIPDWVTNDIVALVNQGTDLEEITKLPGGDYIEEFEHWAIESGLNALFEEVSKPDPYGRVELEIDDNGVGTLALPKEDNKYTPRWFVGWTGVKWARMPTVRVWLFDSDPINDDVIGSALLTFADLQAALAKQATYYVKVGSQTDRQVLYVGVRVDPEGWAP